MSVEKRNYFDKNQYRIIKNNQFIEQISKLLLSKATIENENFIKKESSSSTKKFRLIIDNIDTLKDNEYFNNLIKTGRVVNSVAKTLDILIMISCEKNCEHNVVEIDLKEYATILGKLNDMSGLRKKVKNDLEILKNTIFQCKDKKDKYNLTLNEIPIIMKEGICEIKNGKIRVELSDELLRYLNSSKLYFYMPLDIFKYNDRNNVNSYLLAKRIIFHYKRNENNKNSSIISVEDLYNYCSTLPTQNEIKKSNGAFTKRVIKSFERDLKACSNIFKYFYLSNNETDYTKSPSEWFKEKIFVLWDADVLSSIKHKKGNVIR